MNILKRPMFYAAVVCSVCAALSLFSLFWATVIIINSLIFLTVAVCIKRYKYLIIILCILIFSLSLFGEIKKLEHVNAYNGDLVNGAFYVTEEIIDHGIFNSVVLKEVSPSIVPKGTKIFLVDESKADLLPGDVVNATIKISRIGKNNRFRLSNYGVGIYASAEVVELQQTDKVELIHKTAYKSRQYVKNTFSSYFDGDVAGLMVALTTGDKSLLSDLFLANVKTTGISHVIVVSGMHLSIIMSAIFLMLDRLFYNKYIKSLLSVIIVFLIFWVCGFTTSILRAGAMFIIACFAPIFSRDNDSLNSLLAAVTAVLIATPFAIFNVSFQLSVLSTLAIIWVVPFYSGIITKKLKIKSKILINIINIVLCSIFALIFTLPVTVMIFRFVSIVSPITNLLITFLITITLIFNILSILFFVISPLKLLGLAFVWVSGICSYAIVFIVNSIASLPITVAVLPKSAFWWAIVIIAFVIGFMYFYYFKKKRSEAKCQ